MQRSKQSNAGHKQPLISEAPPALYGGIDMDNLPRRIVGLHTGGVRSADLQIVARKHALDRIHAHGQSSPKIEVCGVLAGDVYRDDMGPYLLVSDIVQALVAENAVEKVAFTPETWSHIYKAMDRDFPHMRIVGWYHTHPGHGLFLSEVDLFLHDNFFDLPWQAALVHDPQSGQDGIFGWQHGAIRRSNYLIESDAPAPVMVPVSVVPPACKIEAAPVVEAAPEIAPAPLVMPAPEMMTTPVETPAPMIMPVPEIMPAPVIELAPMVEPVATIMPVVPMPFGSMMQTSEMMQTPEMMQTSEMVLDKPAEQLPLPWMPARSSGMETAMKVALALVGLVLFVITGLLAGLLIQQFHLSLPHWPNTKWPG